VGTASASSDSPRVRIMSAEFIQKQEAADQDSERNPEMEVGGDHAEKIA
jgi:hypothetical protein